MSVLRIFLFGPARIEHDGRPSSEKATRAVQALLAYLLLQRHRTHSREVLLGLFWGEQPEERARGSLNTTLWRLRRVLEPDGVGRGTYLINGPHGEIGFNSESNHWLDVAVLENAVEAVFGRDLATVDPARVEQLEVALAAYTGELLEGNYSDWALRERERLRALYLKSLAWLMHYHQDHGAFEKSLACGEKILALDPLREEIHRAMMRLYLANGQRGLAMRQYRSCRTILASELDVQPMEETEAVHAQIVGARHESGQPHRLRNAPLGLQPALERLREALQGVEHARVQCTSALRLVERLTRGRQRKLTDR